MADGDITDPSIPAVRVDRDHLRVSQAHFYFDTQTCKVVLTERDSGGTSIGKRAEGAVLIQNIADDSETPEDETDNRFTQLIANINNNSNFKISIANRTKNAMGL